MFVDFHILNELGTPSMLSNIFANRPAAGETGRLFVSTDTYEIYRDNGTTWDLIGGPGSSTITGTGTATQVAYFTSSQAIGSSANLFWDDTNGRLGVKTATPGASLDVHGTGTNIQLNSTGATNNVYLAFQRIGAGVWRIGDTYNAGSNYFGIYNNTLTVDALQIAAATNKTTWTAQETYTTGQARGNFLTYNLTVGAGGSFSSPNAITALGATLNLSLGGNATIPTGARSGLDAYNTVNFTSSGTLTQTQGTKIRAFSNLTTGWAFAGSATGTITDLAGLHVLFPDNSGSAVTVTNNYALLINDQTTNTGTVTYTNRWGIYQEGTSDLNYMAANLLLGSTSNNGLKLQVTGQGYFSGNVGIAVIPSAWRTSEKVLQIGTATSLYDVFGITILGNNFYTNSSPQTIYLTNGYSTYYSQNKSDGSHSWYIAPSGTAGNVVSFTQAMTLDASGNLGIGTTPAVRLHAEATNSNVAIINVIGTAPNYIFDVRDDGVSKFRVDPSGNVGIGTTSISYPLTVGVGGSATGVLRAGTSFVSIDAGYQSAGVVGTAAAPSLVIGGDDNTGIWHPASDVLAVSTAGSERMRITSGGNVLIGTTTDNGQKLQVSGNLYLIEGTNRNIAIGTASNYLWYCEGISNDFRIRDLSSTNVTKFLYNGGVEFSSYIKTGSPNTGTAANWKLGSRVAATVVVNTTEYIEVDIGGTLYKLATVS